MRKKAVLKLYFAIRDRQLGYHRSIIYMLSMNITVRIIAKTVIFVVATLMQIEI